MQLENENVVGPRAGRKEWIGLAVIAIACLLYVMDLSVLYLAVPSLTQDLEPSSSQLLWITDIYGFMVAGFLITMGTLGDRVGRRRVLLFGAAAFGAASMLAAFSPSAEMLIASRALLGVAGATVAPSTLSLIRNMFLDPQQRTTAIGVWGTSFAAGGAVGPLVGGILLERFWWGSVFLINVPVMALLLILGPRLLPEFRNPEAGRLDLTSAAMSLSAVLGVIYGLKQIAQDGFGWLPVMAIAAGLAFGVAFVRRQTRLADPLIDIRFFRVPAFSVSVATNALAGFIAFGTFLYIAQYLQSVLGLSPWHAALWSLPSSIGVVAGSMLAPAILRGVRPALAAAGGLGLVALGPRDPHPSRGCRWACGSRVRIRRLLPGTRPPVRPDHRPDRGKCAARAGRGGLGDLRNGGRAGRGARYRDPRKHRRGHIPQQTDQCRPRCGAPGGRRRGARHHRRGAVGGPAAPGPSRSRVGRGST